MDLDISDIDVKSMFENIQQANSNRFAENGVILKLNAGMDAARFRADAQRLRQVIGNLLSNSVNHAPEGSTVTLSARRDGGQIIIGVHDQGPGIPADVVNSVFDRFVAHGASGKRGGTGLGLSIVKGLVELHHGSVAIHSKTGEGTLVECRFPANPAAILNAAE